MHLFTLFILLAQLSMYPHKMPQLNKLEQQGWQVQHSCVSYDSLSIYFSGKSPSSPSYDIYAIRVQKNGWSVPEELEGLNSDEDEWWPSISSDDRTIYFIRRTPPDAGVKDSKEKSQIYTGYYTESGAWREVVPIIISGEEDLAPQIMEDNMTLLFWRKSPKGRKKSVGRQPYTDGEYHPWWSVRMDDHNWLLADTCSRAPHPKAIVTATGVLTDARTQRTLSDGRVYVYDAITQQLLQVARVHPVTGRFRLALQAGGHYTLDMTASGYSHYYAEYEVSKSSVNNEHISFDIIPLSAQLHVRIQSYDQETYVPLGDKSYDLSIGQKHSVRVSHPLYHDTVLELNTQRQVRFFETELDVPLKARKRPCRFVISNSKNGEPVPSGEWHLDNDPWRAMGEVNDTILRLGLEKMLFVSAPGYLFYDTLFNVGKSDEPCVMSIGLTPLEKDMVLQLRNIQFETNSYLLTGNSITQLEQLVKLLQTNPTLCIEVSAHTDDQGTDSYNDRLSFQRGKVVADYLYAQGIEPTRVEAKGYGKRKPLAPNDTEEHRALNRRVEFKVISY